MDQQYEEPEAVSEYVKFMNYLDTTRNTNWKSVFPEVYQLILKS